MQLNWGLKITILYAGFVILIISMVGLTMREKVDLVSKDYYEQELKYQDKINKVNRTNMLKEPLTWELKPGALVLTFPEQFKGQKISGSIYFFRPSDATLDKRFYIPESPVEMQRIPTATLKKGLYKMQVNWEVNQETYYNEGIIQIN